jgi:hypothetical protein
MVFLRMLVDNTGPQHATAPKIPDQPRFLSGSAFQDTSRVLKNAL